MKPRMAHTQNFGHYLKSFFGALPYLCLVGHKGSPEWQDTAVAFTTLYHQLAKGVHVTIAVEAMKTASGDQGFFSELAETSVQSFQERIASLNLPGFWNRIEQQTKKPG